MEAGIEGEAVEDGDTLFANALKKAHFVQERRKTPGWSMADDTGLFIRYLDGAPGIKAARWAGETATTDEITHYTLKQLIDALDRTAVFETAVAVVGPDEKEYFFSGQVGGKILEAPRVPPQPKMPYSSIFMPHGTNKVWAEMTTEEENRISHRGIAFRQARKFLEGVEQKIG